MSRIIDAKLRVQSFKDFLEIHEADFNLVLNTAESTDDVDVYRESDDRPAFTVACAESSDRTTIDIPDYTGKYPEWLYMMLLSYYVDTYQDLFRQLEEFMSYITKRIPLHMKLINIQGLPVQLSPFDVDLPDPTIGDMDW